MKQYRVTKYDPQCRDITGAYQNNEWTSFSDIGKSVSREEYEKVEAAYINTAMRFLKEQGILELRIIGLENHGKISENGLSLSEGAVIKTEFLEPVLREILREQYWAKLESENTFLHFGYDYYMYVGIPNNPKEAVEYATRNGLFVEEFDSPYRVSGRPHR